MSNGQSPSEAAITMQRSLSTSLYWYVEKSLEDLLEGYMLLGKDEQVGKVMEDEGKQAERNQLISYMLDLPLEFDGSSRQLAASLILGSIKRHIKSTSACKYLLSTLLRKKSDISGILKSDFLTLIEHIFFREVKKEDYLKPEAMTMQENSSVEMPLHPKVESRAYADILVELYFKDFVSATQVLVYLEQLSLKQCSYYHTDLLLFLLNRIGASVEGRMNRGTPSLRNGGTPTSSYSSLSTRTTFDDIFKRLESLLPYVVTAETRQAYDNVIKERKKMKMRSRVRREASNSHVYARRANLYVTPLDFVSPSSSSRVVDIEINNISNDTNNNNAGDYSTSTTRL